MTPSTFWSTDLKTNNSSGIWTDPHVGAFLNQTPFDWSRYGTWTEECNISSDIQYGPNGSQRIPCAYNLTAFKLWCLSRSPRCHVIMPLPGENNNSREDASIAKFIVKTLGFQPDYFSVGNEPDLWKHYGIPWANWSYLDHRRPTPLAYAIDLRNAIGAVRAVDPSARFVGIEATCSCDSYQIGQVLHVDGPNISAVAYHSYPYRSTVTPTLQKFLDPLVGAGNVTSTYQHVRAAVNRQCPSCSGLPVFLNEFNAGPGWTPSVFNGTYANALFLAASSIQALRANVSQFTIFSLQSNQTSFGYSMMNGTSSVGPTGLLFSRLIDHLAMGSVYATHIVTNVPSVWSVLTENSSKASLFVVNANLTRTVHLHLSPLILNGTTGDVYTWDPGNASPKVVHGKIAGSYDVPPEGMLLVLVSPKAIHGPSPHPAATIAVNPVPAVDREPRSPTGNGPPRAALPPFARTARMEDP
ncbi:MAG: hypothetical protein L3K09_06935 [Thermoplasmata archaeon]|nr:hypothetical protein [Thermoplasmata archaeon]